jgi:hypothetical protein
MHIQELVLKGRIPSKKNSRAWTNNEIEWFIKNYPENGKAFCCEHLKRSEPSIRAMADKLKLKSKFKHNKEADYARGSAFRGKKRPDHSDWLKKNFDTSCMRTPSARKKNSKAINKAIQDGRLKTDNFKGFKHTDAAKEKMAKATMNAWADQNHFFNSNEHRQNLSDRSSRLQQERPSLNRYSRGNGQHCVFNGKKIWLRSSCEVVYAEYLQLLFTNKQIKQWQYEPETFWFEKIKRGCRSYKPDFKITNIDGSEEYHEVKGWMDNKSKTKIKRMAIYYPKTKLVIIGEKEIKEIKKILPTARNASALRWD